MTSLRETTIQGRLNALLLSMPAGANMQLDESEIAALQEKFPTWIPVRNPNGEVWVSNLVAKPEGVVHE